ATGFAQVRASSSAGQDAAFLSDSTGDDLLRSTPQFTFLGAASYLNLVSGFAQVNAAAGSGGNDAAELFDTPGNDTFSGQGVSGTLATPTYVVNISRFGTVRATSTAGGFDHIVLGAINYVFQQFGNWQ